MGGGMTRVKRLVSSLVLFVTGAVLAATGDVRLAVVAFCSAAAIATAVALVFELDEGTRMGGGKP